MVGCTCEHWKIKLLHPGKVFLINDDPLNSYKRMKNNLLNIFPEEKGFFVPLWHFLPKF